MSAAPKSGSSKNKKPLLDQGHSHKLPPPSDQLPSFLSLDHFYHLAQEGSVTLITLGSAGLTCQRRGCYIWRTIPSGGEMSEEATREDLLECPLRRRDSLLLPGGDLHRHLRLWPLPRRPAAASPAMTANKAPSGRSSAAWGGRSGPASPTGRSSAPIPSPGSCTS
jgi:hypothetical protein